MKNCKIKLKNAILEIGGLASWKKCHEIVENVIRQKCKKLFFEINGKYYTVINVAKTDEKLRKASGRNVTKGNE